MVRSLRQKRKPSEAPVVKTRTFPLERLHEFSRRAHRCSLRMKPRAATAQRRRPYRTNP